MKLGSLRHFFVGGFSTHAKIVLEVFCLNKTVPRYLFYALRCIIQPSRLISSSEFEHVWQEPAVNQINGF